jgi:putative flippase GtrA
MIKKLKKHLLENHLYLKHKEKVKFAMVGGMNTVLDFTIYGVLVHFFGVFVVVANLISTAICMVTSFVLNYNFVWESKKSKRETAPKFVALSMFTAWVVQSGVIWLIVTIFGGDDVVNLLAKVGGICVGMVCNYIGYKYIFR